MPKIKFKTPTFKRTVYANSSTRTTTQRFCLPASDHPEPAEYSASPHSENVDIGSSASSIETVVEAGPSTTPQSAVNEESTRPSPYYVAKSKEVTQWQALREGLFDSFIDGNAPVPDLGCVECDNERPTVLFRCLNCGPFYQGCKDCVVRAHRYRPYHELEEWKVCMNGLYMYLPSKLSFLKTCIQVSLGVLSYYYNEYNGTSVKRPPFGQAMISVSILNQISLIHSLCWLILWHPIVQLTLASLMNVLNHVLLKTLLHALWVTSTDCNSWWNVH